MEKLPRRRRRLALRFLAGLSACLALPIVLIMQMPTAPAVGVVWDLANLLGYLALACCLLLFVYAGRPRHFPPFSGRFFANLHRDLGYIALLLLTAHVGFLLVSEPLLLEHLKPAAPMYMLAGLLASVILLILVVSSIPHWRRRIWPDYHHFKFLHALLAVVCLALACWHTLESHFYLNTGIKAWIGVLVTVTVFVFYLRGRYFPQRLAQRQSRIHDTALYSRRIALASLVLLFIAAIIVAVVRVPV